MNSAFSAAKPWSIILDFGDVPAGHPRLVMDGWVEFPTASASIAASQSKVVHFMPPVLDLRLPDGSWKRIHDDPGFPAGKMKTVLVDLAGRLPAGRVVLRISSTQRLHWDSFFLAFGDGEEVRVTDAPLLSAEHSFHGMTRYPYDEAAERHPHPAWVEEWFTRPSRKLVNPEALGAR